MFVKYTWKVVLRNERMGFQKSFSPVAFNWQDAAQFAERELEAKGYDSGEFVVIEIKRGTSA